MAKIDLVKDLLVKINNVFRTDMYLIHNKYCMGGIESEDLNPGRYLCVLTEDVKNVYDGVLKQESCYFIPSIRDAKNTLTDNIEELKKEEREKKEHEVDKMVRTFHEVTDWHTFSFSEEEIKKLFDAGDYIYFKPEGMDGEVVISKSLFPMIKEKDFQNVCYHVNKEIQKDLNQMLIIFDFKYFQLYMEYMVITMKFQ